MLVSISIFKISWKIYRARNILLKYLISSLENIWKSSQKFPTIRHFYVISISSSFGFDMLFFYQGNFLPYNYISCHFHFIVFWVCFFYQGNFLPYNYISCLFHFIVLWVCPFYQENFLPYNNRLHYFNICKSACLFWININISDLRHYTYKKM